MKQYRTTLIALGILVVLVAAFLVARPFLFRQEEEPGEEGNTYETVLPFSRDDIVKLESQFQERFVLEKKDSGSWSCLTHPEITLYSVSLTTILTKVVNLSGTLVAEGDEATEDLSRFGFAEDSYYLTCTLKDGSEYKLIYGTKSHSGSKIYVRVEGVPKIYTISQSDAKVLQLTKISLISSMVLQFDDKEKIQDFSIQKKGERTLSAKADFSGSEKAWNVFYPISIDGDTDEINKLIDTLTSLTLADLAASDCQDLSLYGLDNPSVVYTLADNKTSRSLSFGSLSANNQYYYCTFDGGNDVYTILAESVTFLDTDPINYIYRYVFLESVEGLSQVRITFDGADHVLDMAFTDNTATYIFDGVNVVSGGNDFSTPFKKILTSLLSIKLQALEAEPAERGSLLAEVVYKRLDGSQVTVSCYQRDVDNTTMHLYVDGVYAGGYTGTRSLYGTAEEYGLRGCLDSLLSCLAESAG